MFLIIHYIEYNYNIFRKREWEREEERESEQLRNSREMFEFIRTKSKYRRFLEAFKAPAINRNPPYPYKLFLIKLFSYLRVD